MEEIENFYRREVEKTDFQYLKNLKEGIPRKKAESIYLNQIKKIRAQYYKKYENYHSSEKKKIRKKELKEAKNKFDSFKFEGASLKFGFFEKMKIKKAIWVFNKKRKLRNFFYKITPKFAIYLFFRIKKEKKIISKEIGENFEKKEENLKFKIKRIIELIKEKSIKFVNKIKEILNKILIIFHKNKKQEKGEEKPKN